MSRVDEDLISYRLRRAQETLEDAALLLQNRRLHSAVNRLYYALFYGVLALLQTKGLSSSKHKGVRTLLNREFVKTGLLSREFGQFYRELFEDRQEGDYVDYVEFTEEDDESKNSSTVSPACFRIARRAPSGKVPGWFGIVVRALVVGFHQIS